GWNTRVCYAVSGMTRHTNTVWWLGVCCSVVFVGGFCGGVTPGPFPNPEAKPTCADGTAPGRVWESKTPPALNLRIRSSELDLVLRDWLRLLLFAFLGQVDIETGAGPPILSTNRCGHRAPGVCCFSARSTILVTINLSRILAPWRQEHEHAC